jgi:hypothetical protein
MVHQGRYPMLAALQALENEQLGQADNERDEDEDGAIDTGRVLADVNLARTPRASLHFHPLHACLTYTISMSRLCFSRHSCHRSGAQYAHFPVSPSHIPL